MIRNLSFSLLAPISLVLFALGCESGGVGEPCTPEDEYQEDFNGFAVTEVNVESRSFQCETRVCLVNHFRGRVSCPYGQSATEATTRVPDQGRTAEDLCRIPGSNDPITVAVDAQLVNRKTSETVYCSCRCDGPQSNARYCECPSGYSCSKLIDDIKKGGGQLAGSYCIKEGTELLGAPDRTVCVASAKNCGNSDGS
jgi:hypothetical protein